ncbi:bifunctional UDP-N-acetylglucosamine diphosphorylase/glucosamine-1-phosphate N-acetyltransferase GlmU [Roseomonas sp. SSH11]|uniref:Bifunctional protein GlmU n=1 Tax=Pararoseomonas baculiformis TaxID=2820812 RepID=A0ABS4AJ23_9PROT|nr:bifunctional UDP-N-acetylglucosamine diphosphorylase/glucosamine-1-phosphate N-acetyltransferase GlmU [Pararoseomonas baculiformis]MBP0446515.1 bifunctional UDP-N-acetylglucosamine diphosphorylase/glucosamine-1-phosphate N-acetyltransferase GlmU [Pararoseomonas baculiformis]
MKRAAILLAAGLGTRMRSSLPKAMHPIAGRPMLNHLIASCEEVFDRIVVVTGPDMPALERAAAPHATVVQHERLGTGHAALQAAPLLEGFEGDVAVLYADNPLISAATLRRLVAARDGADLVLLAMRPADPARYGRVLPHEDGGISRIVEWKDASEAERAITLCNVGVICAPAPRLFAWLRAVRNDNASGEYYLTDTVAAARDAGCRAVAVEAEEAECRGINSRMELAAAEAAVQAALRERAMAGGATLIRPESVTLSHDTVIGQDVTIGPDVVIAPGVTIEDGVEIRAFSHLEACLVRRGAVIGPFARLRPGTEIGAGAHVGNFVELKAALLGEGAKANHLSYIGDASIGAGSNIGAGTITCNYDGFAKHRTRVGQGVFIGSNATLVAPVALHDGAFVAAGSTITADVAPDAMAFGRARQEQKEGRAAAFRASRRKEKT